MTLKSSKAREDNPGIIPSGAKEPRMADDLDALVKAGALRSIDRHFALWVSAKDPQDLRDSVALAGALVSFRLNQGDVCVDLAKYSGKPLFDETHVGQDSLYGPDLDTWLHTLSKSQGVCCVHCDSVCHLLISLREHPSALQSSTGSFRRDGEAVAPDPAYATCPAALNNERPSCRPLVLDGTRLYLARYWYYETALAYRLLDLARGWIDVSPEALRTALEKVFPPLPEGETVDWQRIATAVAAMKRLCIISGGPGTGKTHTVTAILRVLSHLQANRPLRIALAAPTGKAAARITESIRKVWDSFPQWASWVTHMPPEAMTLHRLLGFRPMRSMPRHNPENLLHVDVLIVDEASMIDLQLMSDTVAALPDHARLILLGDKDQLASVEPGSIFSDLCGPRGDGQDSRMRSQPVRSTQWLEKIRAVTGIELPADSGSDKTVLSPLSECTVFLEKNYRFPAESALGQLAACIRMGGPVALLNRWNDLDEKSPASAEDSEREVRFRSVAEHELRRALSDIVQNRICQSLKAECLEDAFSRFEDFRILCALRESPFGVGPINDLVEDLLASDGLIPRGTPWYKGKPVLVVQNDYDVGLFNGDVGILWPENGGLMAWFRRVDGSFRKVRLTRLPLHETAYAMTVHKAQGSEFSHVLLILPRQDAKVLSRELLYTAVTRARKSVEIWADEDLLNIAAGHVTDRSSGLCDRLWKLPKGQAEWAQGFHDGIS